MAIPATQKKWIINGTSKGLDEYHFTQGPVSKVEENKVLVKLHAAALNFRDLMIPRGDFPYMLDLPVVGGSDGAGEVVEVGSKVTKWKVGDRVATVFNPGHQSGPITAEAFLKGGIGGTMEGTFQEYGLFEETGLVRLASNLSYLEGATLSDAAVTAWNALYGLKPLKPGDWVLVQGTGGVSLFAVQFAKAGGARVVATTSSTAKFDILKRLGADHIINYNEDKEWGLTARRVTTGQAGFDQIVEVGGTDTMTHSLNAIKLEGVITVIGLVTGFSAPDNIMEVLKRVCTLRGIHVGSRVHMEDMMAAMEANKIQPVVDQRIFALEELRDALEYLKAQNHVGKVAVEIV
ncbi:hypothetical protein H2200_009532 [Cladophialophora chaetospira]|uniref:Enoyl reductase (ER) domain-containing protein n=1 Tax=Cladophialophora chaetospira TaxID=386627 RepID=A0AA38X2U1_9EURO|nr:hypothetical protein H2200_009532 [Cladophialophora chaetospira]